MRMVFIKFYPADWQANKELRRCGAVARGVWIEFMCVMMQTERYGYLEEYGKPISVPDLALITGLSEPEITAGMKELVEKHVCSRCPDTGAIYSRRMVRDHERRMRAREAGSRGGYHAWRQGEKVDAAPEQPPLPGVDEPAVPGKPKATPTAPVKTFKQWDKADLTAACEAANADGLLHAGELAEFVEYWMEPTASGRSRMSLEKTWDTRRRMKTALDRVYEAKRMREAKTMPSNRTPVAAIPDYSEEFDALFGNYPVQGRVNKLAAWREWQAQLPAIEKLAGGDMKAWLIKVVSRLRVRAKTPKWMDQGGKYIPEIENWLKNGGYEE